MKRFFYDWLFYVILWVVVTTLYSFIIISFIRAILDHLDLLDKVEQDAMVAFMVSTYQYFDAVFFGVLFGTATFGINLIVDNTGIHKLSYGKTIVIKTILYFLAMVVIFWFFAGIVLRYRIPEQTAGGDEAMHNGFPYSFYIGAVVFFMMSTMLINFVALMNKKFGPGQMLLIFLGKYHRPITENRVFMFLDLKDSTTTAEKLGHIIYSKLLQECFLDLNRLIPASKAEIYQYVGDEAVLTWKIRSYHRNFSEPVKLFFAYRKRLEKRAKFYQQKFGMVPEFKAGINAGVVTVAEIGDLKREIAYHGDVVNTAARLRGACNEFNKKLLASEYVIQNIKHLDEYKVEEIGEVNLRGKQQSIKVFSIE